MIKIVTEHPHATFSPDFLTPVGSVQDNHSNEVYLSELERVANKKPFSYLDLGCAGGQAVVDIHNKGYVSCGVEGSDPYKMLYHSTNGVADNWLQYKDECLFNADIAKPFNLINDEGDTHQFDIVVAWDVLEHPKPEEIPHVIDNIKKHLDPISGIFICLINTVESHVHQCIRPEEWWLNIFAEKGFKNIGFQFNASPRSTQWPLSENDIGLMLKLGT